MNDVVCGLENQGAGLPGALQGTAPMTIQLWSTDRIEQLKASWHAGLSASQIATELGSVTRSAVIGKLHRLGLRNDSRPRTSSSQHRKPRLSRLQSVPTTHGRGAPSTQRPISPTPNGAVNNRPQPAPPTAVAFDHAVEQPTYQRLSLSQLTGNTCHWPIGDPAASDFFFCGNTALSGQPYCPHHARLAYRPRTHNSTGDSRK